MTVHAILSELDRRGVRLRAVDGMVRYKPSNKVDRELRTAMLERKPELLTYLRRRCYGCGGGLQRDDADGVLCSTCTWFAARLEPRRVQ